MSRINRLSLQTKPRDTCHRIVQRFFVAGRKLAGDERKARAKNEKYALA